MEQTRADLKIKFSDGKRPPGADFSDLIDSFVNTKDDNLKKDTNGNFIITLGDTASGPAGTLRFTASKVQFFDGTTWQDVGTGTGGGFQPIPSTQDIAYTPGRVVVGTEVGTPDTTARFEVNLAANEKAKIGNASVFNGVGVFGAYAEFSHNTHANNDEFALRQGPNGDVDVNAQVDQLLNLSKGGNAQLTIPASGNVIIHSNAELPGAAGQALQVNGGAFKNDGTGTWAFTSDVRVKKEIRPFADGLDKVLQINPVMFKYNGKAKTPDGIEQVGIIGQEIAEVLPYTVTKSLSQLDENETPSELLLFNPHALTYVLINAIKELNNKVKGLEDRLQQLNGIAIKEKVIKD